MDPIFNHWNINAIPDKPPTN